MTMFKRRLSDHNVYLVSVMLNLLRINFLAFFKLFKLLVMENIIRSTQFKLCKKNQNLKESNIIKNVKPRQKIQKIQKKQKIQKMQKSQKIQKIQNYIYIYLSIKNPENSEN